jgi:hypothetical protein
MFDVLICVEIIHHAARLRRNLVKSGKAMTTGEGDGRVEEVHLLRKVIRVRRVAVEEGGW